MSHAPRHSKARRLSSGSSPPRSGKAVEELVGAAQRARDVRAHVDVVAPDGLGEEHVVEGRDRRQVGGGQAHHARGLLDALAASTSRSGLDRVQSAGIAAERMVRVAAPCGPRCCVAQLLGHRRGRGIGDAAGSLVRSAASSQPGTREPCPKRGTLVGSIAITGRSLRGSGRAWRASR